MAKTDAKVKREGKVEIPSVQYRSEINIFNTWFHMYFSIDYIKLLCLESAI